MHIGFFWQDELQAVQDLLRANGWRDEALPTFEAIMHSRSYTAIADDELAGFIRVITDESLVTYVCEIVVHTKFVRRGVGRALLDHVQNQFPGTRIDLLSTQGDKGFYEATGFSARPGYRRYDE